MSAAKSKKAANNVKPVKAKNKAETQTASPMSFVAWLLAVALLAAGLWANYHFHAVALPLRLIGWIVLTIVILGLLTLTTQGKKAVGFFSKSRNELGKVVWPSRQETIQTTMIVLVLVAVLALIIWALDGALYWLIGWLTGQRG